jgi:hypothetical protein
MTSHSSTANLVGVHYRVGKKIGEGSFGVIFEGQLSALFRPWELAFYDCLDRRDQSAQLADGRNQICASSSVAWFLRA